MAVDQWFSIAIPLLAAVACGFAGWQRPGRGRLAWALLGLSGAGWAGIAGLRLLAPEVDLPFSLLDLRFGAALAPAVIAVALLPSAPPLFPDRLRTLFDGAVVAAALVFISWDTGLGVAYRSAGGDLNSRLNALTHPFGDLVLAVLVTFLLYGALRVALLSRLLLGLGLLLAVVADSAATWSQFRPDPGLSGLTEWGWIVAFALIAVAALQDWREARMSSMPRPAFAAAASILYLPVLGAAAVAAWQQLEGQLADPFLFWNGLILVALIVAREILTLTTNRYLRKSFDERLAKQTDELRRSAAYYQGIVDQSADPLVLLDGQGRIRYESRSIERLHGRPAGSSVDRPWLELIHPEDQERLRSILEKSRQAPGVPISTEGRLSHGDAGWRQVEISITNLLQDQALAGFLIGLRDITERKALEEQLVHHAMHDPVTGLPNRALFRDRLHQSVARAARRREQPAVLLIDIDGLKKIAETLGNEATNDVLVAVADRLRESVRSGDSVARFGTDEFAVLLEDTQQEAAPAMVADRILTELARVKIGEASTPLSAGIGIAALSPGLQNPDELLRNADTSLAEAKAAGSGKIAIYDRHISSAVTAQLELEADLQRAIERKEFVVHYQPIIRLNDGWPTAVEALVRWVHPWRGMLLPGDFILAADKTGAIVSLGRWLLLEASRQVRRWQQDLKLPTLGLAVNLSVRQLNDPGLANDIRHVIGETGLEPALLMLETQESTVLDDPARAAEVFAKLKDLGANLAVDDCRSGPTSLGYIRHLPVDTIKIDRSFIMNLGRERDRRQVQGMIGTASWLKVVAVAEGIEESGQAAELLKMNCELGQGFHFSKPLAASQMFDYLDRTCRAKAA